ncbi:MAG TPA: aldehyde ferredoxin oxidoreductase family protein [Desulfotomaculum sp.]|nr:aldehyde ferredoxin oxidoreductase family protein [Desulfotomaculum sp.]
MNGYQGKMLRVNLSSGTVTTEDLNTEWARQYFGGKGLGYRYLFEELPAGADPLGEKNRLILMTGPFTGTVVPCSGKLAIITRSPATGTILDCSVGGGVAAELKFAGYDGVIIEGKSPQPVYLYINNGQVLLESAASLWGRGTHDTELALREKYGDEVKVLSIGPAGENLVPFACITSEFYRQAGRGGVGAVMGSKNLKAIVIRGTGDVRVADMQGLLRAALEAMRADVHTDTNLWAHADGTPMIVELSQQTGILPTRNFQQGTFDGWERLGASSVKQFTTAKKGCFSCALGCGNYVRVNGVAVEGPEYETLAMAGANCGIGDLQAVVQFNQLCDDLGLDTISTGSVTAYAMEMTQKGIHDFGLSFGDVTAYLEIPRLIATRTGAGELLALGVRALSEKYGGRDFAMHVKGLELPGYEPRGAWGMGLAYATAPRGGCHMSAWPVAEETYGEGDPFTIEGKAQMVKDLQDYNAVKFSLILCDFWAASLEWMARLATAVLGRPVSSEELQKAGERIFTLARMFNVREGFSARDDTLPPRVFREPLPSGATSGKVLPEDQFRAMLQEYYTLRGWDGAGRPPLEQLREAGVV